MEMLAALGYGAKELFSYNRENYKFDQDQRLERETLRLEMQVKRFELFREDVHDLVELTVDRMDVYHLVGALFLEFCIVLFCEGRIQASAPPFLLSLFLLSNACAFIYLLLGVWLSMHASIAAHSFGVRLLTRFVRLPIPSAKQINALRSRLKDYESQGIGNLLRMPGFTDKQEWKTVDEDGGATASGSQRDSAAAAAAEGFGADPAAAAASSSSLARGDKKADRKGSGYLQTPSGSGAMDQARSAMAAARPSQPDVGTSAPRPTSLGKPTMPEEQQQQRQSANECPEFLAQDMDFPLGGEDLLSGGKGAQPERHIQLFRQLQSKWQCYDAYCRVCMGLGVNQILQGLSYYCICHTLVENHSPTTGYALVVLFQCTTIALAVLDLAGMKRREIIAVQVVGILPCLLTGWGVAHGMRDENGVLDPEQKYMLSPLSFLCQVFWLELWLRVAAPSRDESRLPRRFRQVLFLDVFGDAEGWDPTQEEDEDNPQEVLDGQVVDGALRELEEEDGDAEAAVQGSAQQAASQLTLVQCALRRWKAVPDWSLSAEQRKQLDALEENLKSWGNTISTELERRAQPGESSDVFERQLRRWQDLSQEERAADPFAKCLVGAFEHDMGYEIKQYYYDVEGEQTLFEDAISKTCPGALVLSLDAVSAIMQDLEKQARQLLEIRITRDLRAATLRQQRLAQERREQEVLLRSRSHKTSLLKKRCASKESGAFPNLVSLFSKAHNAPVLRHRSAHRRALDREQGVELLSDSPSIAPASAASASAVAEPQSSDAELPSASQASTPRLPGSSPRLPTAPAAAAAGAQAPPVQQDQTLRAMAGQNAKHFVPERLPWQVLSRMTRVLQVCWFYSGLMALLKETNVYQVDYQQHPGHEARRLCVASPWTFEQIDVAWPHGDFFRPRGLVCLPGSDLFMASPFAFYRTNETSTDSRMQMEEVERVRMQPNTAVMCPSEALSTPANSSSSSMPCLLAAPGPEGLLVWPSRIGHGSGAHAAEVPQWTVTVPMPGEHWKLLAGAVMRCSRVASMLLEEEEGAAEWCMVLVGWDGEMLPVAALPLRDGGRGQPVASARVLPVFDVPLPPGKAAKDIQALHLEPQRGRLWAVLSSGDLLAWELLQARSLGRFRPQWPSRTSVAFRPTAICEDPVRGELFALGRGPLLTHAQVPVNMLAVSGAIAAGDVAEALAEPAPRVRGSIAMSARAALEDVAEPLPEDAGALAEPFGAGA